MKQITNTSRNDSYIAFAFSKFYQVFIVTNCEFGKVDTLHNYDSLLMNYADQSYLIILTTSWALLIHPEGPNIELKAFSNALGSPPEA